MKKSALSEHEKVCIIDKWESRRYSVQVCRYVKFAIKTGLESYSYALLFVLIQCRRPVVSFRAAAEATVPQGVCPGLVSFRRSGRAAARRCLCGRRVNFPRET